MGRTIRCGCSDCEIKIFHSRSVFSENLVDVELRKLEVKFNKPVYVGMCILDISKTCLYEFHRVYTSICYRCIATNAKLCILTLTVSYH